MNEHTIALVRESFDLIEPIAPQAGAMFCANLLEADPSLARLFIGDMNAQAAELMPVIAFAISQLDEPEVLMPVLEQFGVRLAAHGVRDAHYDALGAALLKTLYQSLGVAYNAEVEAAWVDVYGVVAAKMKQAVAVTA